MFVNALGLLDNLMILLGYLSGFLSSFSVPIRCSPEAKKLIFWLRVLDHVASFAAPALVASQFRGVNDSANNKRRACRVVAGFALLGEEEPASIFGLICSARATLRPGGCADLYLRLLGLVLAAGIRSCGLNRCPTGAGLQPGHVAIAKSAPAMDVGFRAIPHYSKYQPFPALQARVVLPASRSVHRADAGSRRSR